jgi:hypothetical protein
MRRDAQMLGSEKASEQEWNYLKVDSKRTEELLNEAPLDALLTILHSGAKAGAFAPAKRLFMEALILGRYVEANVAAMGRLTSALDRASESSTKIGWGLVAVGIGSVVVTIGSLVLTYYR